MHNNPCESFEYFSPSDVLLFLLLIVPSTGMSARPRSFPNDSNYVCTMGEDASNELDNFNQEGILASRREN